MKRYALGFAVLALSGSPVVAADAGVVYAAAPPPIDSPVYAPQPIITADVGLFLGWSHPEGSDGEGFGGAKGRVNIPLWGWLNEEIEVGGALGFDDGSALAVFSHTYYTDQRFAYGVLLGAQGFGNGSTTHSFTAGVEGAVILPESTLLGLVAYNWAEGPDFWTVGGEGRYYFTPNDKLFGIVRYNSESPHWVVAGGYEHMFEGTNFSASGTVGWSGGSKSTAFAMLTGTYTFGGQTSLQQANNSLLWNETQLVGATLSDMRLKHDIVPVGRLGNGLGLYRYAYNGSDQVYVGVMAQEVAVAMPDAVVQGADGYLRVDYGKLGLHLMTWEEWRVLTGEPLS